MIVAGFGLRASASLACLQALLAGRHVDALAIVADKADHPAIQALAAATGKPLRVIMLENLAPIQTAVQTRAQTPAPHQPARYGKTSLAETTALAAAGPAAALILPRITASDGRATMALAQGYCK